MKAREEQLLKELLLATGEKPYVAGKAIDAVGGDKQLLYYLEKWTDKRWWEYGVSLRSGWFTPEGIEHFKL